jgi:hypothetical protein
MWGNLSHRNEACPGAENEFLASLHDGSEPTACVAPGLQLAFLVVNVMLSFELHGTTLINHDAGCIASGGVSLSQQ